MCMNGTTFGKEYHVSPGGNDVNDGSQSKMLRTISAASRAQPGDFITVHEGVYRERVSPPRGGTSDTNRITYRAADGEKVVITGSEIVKGWTKVGHNTWKIVIPNSFFGSFNPYSDLIRGDWFNRRGRNHHTGAVYQNGHWLIEAAKKSDVLKPIGKRPLWFGSVDETNTTILAQFSNIEPNDAGVEINVRQTVFYPENEGINYITVQGFVMQNAATPWAPPTAEQIGLIGTHWSKGWIIEDNEICYSKCSGVALGKYGDKFDNTSANSAEGYVKTIERAIDHGWSKEKIGHHIVRNNHIHDCEQTGIVGSLGAIFSTISGNEIYNIHIHRLFTGAEMAGIKLHAAIDTVISGNHIYRTNRGIWLDWMTQGTRVTRNLLHDNGPRADLFVEVNHGPFIVDNNLFLSSWSLYDRSEGGAYVHNIFAGMIKFTPELGRKTPYHHAHSVEIAGMMNVKGGDSRFYNNIFAGRANLSVYDNAARPMFMAGNVYTKGSHPSKYDKEFLVRKDFDLAPMIVRKKDGRYLEVTVDPAWQTDLKRTEVTTQMLGLTAVSKLPFVKDDGSPYQINRDYCGNVRDVKNPNPGPFAGSADKKKVIKYRLHSWRTAWWHL